LILPGERGEPVEWLQRRLAALGYLGDPPSGVFDVPTAEAVRSFQRSRSLSVDGAVGPLTKMTLYEALDEYAMPRLVPHGGMG
jgi:peptidoglycan hydrolase-like protein with peptidoglycan-binding domain